jgi:hypothetical protein
MALLSRRKMDIDSIEALEREAEQQVHETLREYQLRLVQAGLDENGNRFKMLTHKWQVYKNGIN